MYLDVLPIDLSHKLINSVGTIKVELTGVNCSTEHIFYLEKRGARNIDKKIKGEVCMI